jgi:hypothetical protein
VIPSFDGHGNLPPGVHFASWDEIVSRYGTNEYRTELLRGFRAALDSLRAAGCRRVYLDGSFVTDKKQPGDFDACWEIDGVDPDLLDPELLDFSHRRAAQKRRYGGELFVADSPAEPDGAVFRDFFQRQRGTDALKGIIAIDLGGFA